MPKPHRLGGTLTVALLILTAGAAGLHAQTAVPSQGSFDERFSVPPVPQSTPAPSTNGTPSGSDAKGPASVLKDLIVPPAEAEPAAPPPSQGAREPIPPAKREAVLPVPAPAPLIAAPVRGKRFASTGRRIATGRAAWYEHPGRTASGETFNPNARTAAHKSLPLGTRLRVVNLRNQRSVVVRVNDRAPPKMKFVIDLSRGSARAIGITDVGPVALYKLD
jgi:rare lipoprotein A